MTAQIQEFRFNDNPWRIDWLGRIIYPGAGQGEPRITVHLSELITEYSDPLSNNSLAEPPRHETVTINVGQLALLKVGSIWIDGIQIQPRKAPAQIDVSIDHDQVSLMQFNDKVTVEGVEHSLLSNKKYFIGINAFHEAKTSWLAVVHNPTQNLKVLAIPSTILFQKCLATSPKAVRRLIYGKIDKIIDPSSGFLKDDPDTYVVELFKDFRDSEAVALSNLKADPVARREFSRFRNSLMVDSVNYDRGVSGRSPPPHMKLSLPFSNPVQITAIGKYLAFVVKRNGHVTKEWGFLVTELISLTPRLVFNRLIIDRKNKASQGQNADDPDLPLCWGNSATKNPANIDDPAPVTSADVPNKHLDQYALEASGGFDVDELQIIKTEKEVQKYRAAPRVQAEEVEENGSVTTGNPQAGSKGSAETDITTDQVPKIPVTLNQFFETIILLRKKGYPFETIAVSNRHRQHECNLGIVNFFPSDIKGVYSWHLSSNHEKAPPRGYVVAELPLGGSWRYLVELQRKGDAKLALQYIRTHSGERIGAAKIEQFLIDVAKENGWRAKKYYRSWICISIRHPPGRDMETFAQAIINEL
jgi:hypothetical protein